VELQLFVTQGSGAPPKLYEFKEPERIVLGRGPESPVPLDGPSISREHLAFEVRDGRVFVIDLSSNGSFLNRQRLPRGEAQRVVEEDEIGVPGYAIAFRLVTPPPEPAPQPTEPPVPPAPPAGKEKPVAPMGKEKPPEAPPPAPQRPAEKTKIVPPTPAAAPRLSKLEWFALLLIAAALGVIAVYWLS
jgi:predicted component of type VI protein secretion system